MDSIPGLGRFLEKGMAIHSTILALRIPWTEGPGGLQSHGAAESDTTEQLTLSLSFQIIRFSFGLTSVCMVGFRFTHFIRTDSNEFLFVAW